jgi:protein disulfide-isomerase A6
MKPAWDQLGGEYEGSSKVLIADADCTVEEDLCKKYDVSGYPTIKYFTDETGDEGEDYKGGRDYDALAQFVTDNLGGGCDVNAPDGCDEKEQAYIAKMKAKSPEDIAKQLERLSGMKGDSMKKELKVWLNKRLSILKQL